jgi:hypothetical protein
MLGGYLNPFLIPASARCCENLWESKNRRLQLSPNCLWVKEPPVISFPKPTRLKTNGSKKQRAKPVGHKTDGYFTSSWCFGELQLRNQKKFSGFWEPWLYTRQKPVKEPEALKAIVYGIETLPLRSSGYLNSPVLPSFSVLGVKQCRAGTRNCTNPSPVIKAGFCSSEPRLSKKSNNNGGWICNNGSQFSWGKVK